MSVFTVFAELFLSKKRTSCMTCGAVPCPGAALCPDCLIDVYQRLGRDLSVLDPPDGDFEVEPPDAN